MQKFLSILLMTGMLITQFQLPALATVDAATNDAIEKGVEYLADNQNNNGSIIGFGGETEWSMIAVESVGTKSDETNSTTGETMIDFLESDPAASESPATTIERKMLAIDAASKDVNNFGGVNYKALLEATHAVVSEDSEQKQIGDPALLTDDMFGLMAIEDLEDAGFDEMAADATRYLVENQKENGGFSYTTATCDWCGESADTTAAGVIALIAAQNMGVVVDGIEASKANATLYLTSVQNPDGGFGSYGSNAYSTSWVLMAFNEIGESVASQATLARNWLIANQSENGAFGSEEYGPATAGTAHAIIALAGGSWANPASLQSDLTWRAPIIVEEPETETSSTPAKVNSPVPVATSSSTSQTIISEPHPTTDETPEDTIVETTDTNENESEDKEVAAEEDATTSWSLWVLLFLGLISFGWYMLQSRKNQEQ